MKMNVKKKHRNKITLNKNTQSNVQIRNMPLRDNPTKEVKQGHSANKFHLKRIEQIDDTSCAREEKQKPLGIQALNTMIPSVNSDS